MKKFALAMFACCLLTQAIAVEPQWLTNLSQALIQAQKENKMVLLDFTGSDWCGWCKKFKSEALDTQDFRDYAGKNLVLVEVDFPEKKAMSVALKRENKNLKEHYKVEGFPTFVLLSKDGKELGRQHGYYAGGAKPFIAKLEKFKSKN